MGGLLADNALYRLRAAQGVLGLADKHQPGRLGAACGKAAVQAGQPEERMAALADTPYALALNPGTGGHLPRDAASPQTPWQHQHGHRPP
jgi:hypothetical protein